MRWLTVVALALLLVGCAKTQSGVNKDYDVEITVSGQSVAHFYMGVDADTAAETMSGDAPASNDIESRLTAAWDAAQAQGIEEGKAFIEGVKNFVEKWQDKRDQSTTTETTTTPPPVVTPPITESDAVSSDNLDFKFMQTLAWGGKDPDPEHDRKWWGKVSEEPPIIPWQYKWIIPMSLDELGKEILVKFSDGDELWVNNTSGITMTTDHKKFRYEGASHVTKNPIVIGARNKKYEWIRIYYNGR